MNNLLVYFIPFYGIYNIIKGDGSIKNNIIGTITSFMLLLFYLGIIGFLIYLFHDRFEYFGIKPLCNLHEERALNINGFVFPLCYRCMCIVLGFTITFILLVVFKPKRNTILLAFGIVGILLCAIDGIMQYGFSITSNNFRRTLTGSIGGIGIGYIIFYLLNFRGVKNGNTL